MSATPADELVVFGATGDLAMRKLLPALCQLQHHKLLDGIQRLVAVGRKDLDSAGYRQLCARRLAALADSMDWDARVSERFLGKLRYCMLDASRPEGYAGLAGCLSDTATARLFYLATAPSLYGPICDHLGAAGVLNADSRIVLEKPLGHDAASCDAIHQRAARVFPESAIFRIDHYLGKESVQNLLALRFGNPLFQPIWNYRYIDNVQITVAESIGAGERASYYADSGALRDMVQNHILQILSLVAMEPPASLSAPDVRDEKVKALRALGAISVEDMPTRCVRGRYVAGVVDGHRAPGFDEECAGAEGTETFVAIKVMVNNWRWANVPFYLRTGKRMTRRRSEVFIEFRKQPFSLFVNDPNEISNQLVVRLQPEEDMLLRMLNKKPGLTPEMRLQPVELHLTQTPSSRRYDAYERLLMDAIGGDQTLFMRRDEVEIAWRWTDAVIDAWERCGLAPEPYHAGTMGPDSALGLPQRDGRDWHE